MGDMNVQLLESDERAGRVEFPVTQGVLVSTSGPSRWTYLTSGIDTLHLGLSVDWTPVWSVIQPKLRQAKEAAEGRHGVEVDLGPHRSVLMPNGVRNYRFNLYNGGWNLMLANSPTATSHPNVFAMLHPSLLWQTNTRSAIAKVIDVIQQMGGTVHEVKPSRVDLCADFVVHPALSLPFLSTHGVSRCRAREHHLDGDRLKTFIVGNGSVPVRLQIYNKGQQVESGVGSEWVKDIWGVNNARNVWRVEFQVRRTLLSEVDIHTVDDLLARTGDLWTYLSTKWFSLRNRDNPNMTRRSIHPWWKSVQDIAGEFSMERSVNRVYRRRHSPSMGHYLTHMAGCLEGFAARLGIDDPEVAWDHIQNAVGGLQRDFKAKVQEKALKLELAMQGGAL